MKYKVEAKRYTYNECLVGGIYDRSNATLMRHSVPIIGFYKGVWYLFFQKIFFEYLGNFIVVSPICTV